MCVRAPESGLCYTVGRIMYLKALLHSFWWQGINRFMRHGRPLYKPGNPHQKEVPPSATYSIILLNHRFMLTRGQTLSVLLFNTVLGFRVCFCTIQFWVSYIVCAEHDLCSYCIVCHLCCSF